jgi:hypothetical protein
MLKCVVDFVTDLVGPAVILTGVGHVALGLFSAFTGNYLLAVISIEAGALILFNVDEIDCMIEAAIYRKYDALRLHRDTI